MTDQIDMFQTGSQLKNQGIQRATDSQNNKVAGWSEKAFHLLRIFLLTQRTPFICEDFRQWCEEKLVEPDEKRAFGGVMVQARKQGLIKSVGYGKSQNPNVHRSITTLWLAC